MRGAVAAVLFGAVGVACAESSPGSATQGKPDAAADASNDAQLGDADPVDAAIAAADLEGLSFDVQFQGEAGAAGWCIGPCTPVTLHVERALAGALSIVWGTPGNAERAQLSANSDGFLLDAPLTLGWRPAGHDLCPPNTRLESATFSFNRDAGGAAQLSATGTYRTEVCSEDTFEEHTTGPVVLSGVIDNIDPTFKAPPALGGLLSLDLSFAEPLRADAVVALHEPVSSSNVTLDPTLDEKLVVGASTDRVLPFGSDLELSFAGKDLGGRPLSPSAKLATLADFGVLVQDGFETSTATGIWPAAGPQIVTDFKGKGAIAGLRMLHVPAGTQAMLRLQRVGAEAELVAVVRVYTQCPVKPGSLRLTAAVVGGTTRTHTAPSMGTPTSLPDSMLIGEVQNIALSLPDPGKDVVLGVLGENHVGFGCSHAGVLIDDVKLQ